MAGNRRLKVQIVFIQNTGPQSGQYQAQEVNKTFGDLL